MKQRILLSIPGVLAAFLLIFLACNKKLSFGDVPTGPDTGRVVTTVPPVFTDQVVKASLKGRVVDENGIPVQNAVVTSGGTTVATDINGIFSFSNISLASRFGFVKAVKTGYFTASRSILTHAGAQNFVMMQLIPRTSKGNFQGGTGGTVTVNAGSTVSFGTSSIVNASTKAFYTGTVNVYAAYLDPTDGQLLRRMPGDLRGIGTDGTEQELQSFGMMVVELEGSSGERLQVASGKTATLTWAIPSSLQSSAPATIPLWYFSDTTGRWVQQGSATKQGNNYVGQVGHFSFWNCDAGSGVVKFQIKIKDQAGNPVAYSYIQFGSSGWGTRGGLTDSAGFAQGLIPKGQALVLKVADACGNVIGSENVGPFTGDVDMGAFRVNVQQTSVTLSGTVVNCNNNPVTNGFVNATIDGLDYRAPVTNGSFSMTVSRCVTSIATAQVVATDFGTLQQGSISNISLSTGNVSAGQLSACGNSVDQLMSVSFNGANYNLIGPPDSFYYSTQGTVTSFAENRMGPGSRLTIGFGILNLTGVGSYPCQNFQLISGTKYYSSSQSAPIQCSISSFGAVGGYVSGTFTGSVTDSTSTYPLTGNFTIKRLN
jgi:hypothetical protein